MRWSTCQWWTLRNSVLLTGVTLIVFRKLPTQYLLCQELVWSLDQNSEFGILELFPVHCSVHSIDVTVLTTYVSYPVCLCCLCWWTLWKIVHTQHFLIYNIITSLIHCTRNYTEARAAISNAHTLYLSLLHWWIYRVAVKPDNPHSDPQAWWGTKERRKQGICVSKKQT